MRKIKRAIHIDFHTMPGIDDFGENFDAATFAETLSSAKVGYINFFGRCNKGFSYYPTKVGVEYPGLKTNMLKDVIDECHKRNIGVTAYLNGCISHEVILRNPKYAKQTRDGSTVIYDPASEHHAYQVGCFNTGYSEHIISEIREMLAYNPDGIFCDCMRIDPCFCPLCVEKMELLGVDMNDDDAVLEFQYNTLLDMIDAIRDVVPEDVRLYFNSSIPYDKIADRQSHVEVECLPTGGWGYEFYRSQANYFKAITDERVYMSGCFIDGWGDFGGKKSKASMENDAYDALIYGYTPSIGDHLHPKGELNQRMYRDIGEIYSYVEQLEPWTEKTAPYAEVAVLRNQVTHKNVLKFLTESDKGVSRMLAELKICFDTINESMDFSKYKLLILPDHIEITDTLFEKLKSYKGSILSSGSSIRQGGVWDFVESFQKDTNTHGFYNQGEEVFGMYNCGIKMTSHDSIADYIEPYFNETFDGKHYYFYIPPKESAGFSAIAMKDRRAHICFNIFEAYNQHGAIFHKELIDAMITQLLPERKITTDLPSTARVTLAEGDDFCLLHIKTTFPEIREARGVVEEHVRMPAGNKVILSGTYTAVKTLPDLKELCFKCKKGKTEITLPEINGYIPIMLEKQSC